MAKSQAQEEALQAEAVRKERLRRAYGKATQVLRENHRDEFNDLYSKCAEAEGEEWHPRLTAEQRASQEFDRLLEEFPFLADRLPTQSVQEG